MSKYAVGVDFGTESGRAVLVDVADGPTARHGRVTPYAQRRHRRATSRPGRRRGPAAGLGAPGPGRLPATCSRPRSRRSSRQAGVRPGRRHRHRDRLHRLHDAAGDRRRHAALRCSRRFRSNPHAWVKLWKHHAAQPEADRINERRPGDRARPGWSATAARSRRSGSSQGAPDPRRGARDLRRRGPADRGDRLGRLAADRGRDAQRLHRRLQGDVVEDATASPTRATSGPSTRRFADVVDDKMRRDVHAARRRAPAD